MNFPDAIESTMNEYMSENTIRRKCWHEDNHMWLAIYGVWECNFQQLPHYRKDNDCLGVSDDENDVWPYILHVDDVMAEDWEVFHL